MRIFVGTTEIAGQIPLLAAGFRALGHKVTTGVYVGHSYKFDTGLTYDLSIQPSDPVQAMHIINSHDLFLFQFGHSLLHGNADFQMIRRAGKKIVSLFNGSDIRYWPAYERQFGIDYRALAHEEPPAFWGLDTLPTVLGCLRRGEMYADLVLSVPNQSVLGLRPYNHFFYPADMNRYTFHVPGRHVPVVVHAPSRLQTKGTAIILTALKSLRAQGVAFELRLLQDVPNADVLAALTDADCAIDQTYLGFGLFAVEGMASGCAVATAHFPHLEGFAAHRPVHPLQPDCLEISLRELLTDRDLRLRLAHEGRAHAQTYHDHVRVCQRILEAIEQGKERRYDYWPRYCATEAVLPEGVFVCSAHKTMSDAIVRQHGLPHNADVEDMVCRGWLSSAAMEEDLPRWPAHVRDWESLPTSAASCADELVARPATQGGAYPANILEINKLATNIVTLCLQKHLPLRETVLLDKMLTCGFREKALLYLYNMLHTMTPPPPSLTAALGILLWGGGQGDASRAVLQQVGASDFMSLATNGNADDGLWMPLARWVWGCATLWSGDTRAALPVLISVLRAMPDAHNGRVCLLPGSCSARVEEGSDFAIAWSKPPDLPHNCTWFSPAAFAPDWCAQCHPSVVEALLPFTIRSAGYTMCVANNDHFWRMLNALLANDA